MSAAQVALTAYQIKLVLKNDFIFLSCLVIEYEKYICLYKCES